MDREYSQASLKEFSLRAALCLCHVNILGQWAWSPCCGIDNTHAQGQNFYTSSVKQISNRRLILQSLGCLLNSTVSRTVCFWSSPLPESQTLLSTTVPCSPQWWGNLNPLHKKLKVALGCCCNFVICNTLNNLWAHHWHHITGRHNHILSLISIAKWQPPWHNSVQL